MDDAEEFEPALAKPSKEFRDILKPHPGDLLFAQELEVNREILLLREPRWPHCFIYKYWFSCVALPYLPAVTTAFCYGIVWASLKPSKTKKQWEKEGDWRSEEVCSSIFIQGVLCFFAAEGSLVSITSMTVDTGQPGILLALRPLPKSSSMC